MRPWLQKERSHNLEGSDRWDLLDSDLKRRENDWTKSVLELSSERRCLPGTGGCGRGGGSAGFRFNGRQRCQPVLGADPCRTFNCALTVVDAGGEIVVKKLRGL
jgi:hypothetical protein